MRDGRRPNYFMLYPSLPREESPHTNIVRYLGFFVAQCVEKLVFEYCIGSLWSHMRSLSGLLDNKRASSFTRQLFAGAQHVHHLGIGHPSVVV
jgi:serine/threonine protein kinase